MKIETKEELKYVMDFYNIPFVPIHDGQKDMGKITRNMNYKGGTYVYKRGFEYMAFELAFKQINDIIELKERINKPFSAIQVYRKEKDTWMYADAEGEPPTHHVYPKTIVTEEESEISGTMDEVFVAHYKANNTLRYCNGYSYYFKDKKVEKLYRLWLTIMPKERSFDLYYGNGIVD